MKRFWIWPAALIALLVAITLAVSIGTIPLSPAEVWQGLIGTGSAETVAIVRVLRLPRVLLAALVGGALAVSGGALQGALRNPLAEPYLLGVSGGAAVGAVAAVTVFTLAAAMVPIAAFLGAIASVTCVILVARAAGGSGGGIAGRSDPRLVLMAGVVVGAFGNAVIMILLSGASPDRARSALWWMMGSVAEADWTTLAWLAGYVALAVGLLAHIAPRIDALTLGDEAAASLGVDVDATLWRVFFLASLLAAATVSASGLVGFVGLVVPHLARGFGVRGQRQLLFASLLTGAVLLVFADLLARTVQSPRELPLGAVTALIGVPYFLSRLKSIR